MQREGTGNTVQLRKGHGKQVTQYPLMTSQRLPITRTILEAVACW